MEGEARRVARVPGNSWKSHVAQCPSCGFRFIFTHSLFGAKGATRYGDTWIFICPNCHTRQAFIMSSGMEKDLSLYMIPGMPRLELRVIMGIVGITISIVLLFYGVIIGQNPALVLLSPFLIVISAVVAPISAIYIIYSLEEAEEKVPPPL